MQFIKKIAKVIDVSTYQTEIAKVKKPVCPRLLWMAFENDLIRFLPSNPYTVI